MPKKRFALIGSPIQHSLSPYLYNTAFEILEIDARYESLEVDGQALAGRWHDLSETYAGLNVTIPLKESVVSLLDERSVDADDIGAVNTVTFSDGVSKGMNTDWRGFLDALHGSEIRGTDVVVFGAGGAARAVLYAMVKVLHPKNIWILNRTAETAERLVRDAMRWQPVSKLYTLTSTEELTGEYSLAVQATPVGLDGTGCPVSEDFFENVRIAFDLVYCETLFLGYARRKGCQTIHGIEMLVGQAARAFEIFTGRSFPERQVRDRMQKEPR